MEGGIQVLMEGAIDSARDSAIAGWARSHDEQSHIVAILFDQDLCRIRLCRHNSLSPPGEKRFYFDQIDPETILRILIGKASIVAVALGAASVQLDAATGAVQDCDLDPSLFSGIDFHLLRHGNAMRIADSFKDAAVDCIAIHVGALTTSDTLISRLQKSDGFEPSQLFLKDPVRENLSADTAYFEIPVGTISKDTSTIVGKNGHLFLFEGTNFLLNQYNEFEIKRKTFKRWRTVLEHRKAVAYRLSAKFIQVIIPEKTTVLKDLFPIRIDAPTYSLRHFRSYTSDLPYVYDILPEILVHPYFLKFYRKTDSHLDCRACEIVANMILERLGLQTIPAAVMGESRIFRGDLGRRFPGIVETLEFPSADVLSTPDKMTEVRRHLPPAGKHEGINVVWRNPDAPIDKCVIAFANSFFGMGDHPYELSWWFARYFREFHFVWSRNIDEEYIKTVGPDIIIAQTIERFLPLVPEK